MKTRVVKSIKCSIYMVDGGSEEAGGSVVASFSMKGVGGLMVFLVFVDRETEMEREDGREREYFFYLVL